MSDVKVEHSSARSNAIRLSRGRRMRIEHIVRFLAPRKLILGCLPAIACFGYATVVFADYSGTHISCTGNTIAPGEDLEYTITVHYAYALE